ncbi:MAG: DUF433 domain-containing protein [Planctomycetaceae bacterium]|nr:DUF433 domain-containing protein [Planctomycetaceae bacterium]
MTAAIIDRGRGPEIAGTRITVFDVLDYVQAGWDDKGIAVVLSLGTDQVRAAREYIENHPAEIQAGFQRIKERIGRGNPPEVQAKLAAARAKLRARLERARQNGGQGNGNAEHPG